MRITAHDVSSRVTLSRLLLKIDQDREYGHAIGVENTSFFQTQNALQEKGKENVKPDISHTFCRHSY